MNDALLQSVLSDLGRYRHAQGIGRVKIGGVVSLGGERQVLCTKGRNPVVTMRLPLDLFAESNEATA